MRNGPDKNPFKSVSDLLFRASPASRTHHFLAYIIDLILVFITSYLLFLGGNSITTNSKSYKKNYAKYTEEVTYYQDVLVEAHVAEYLSREDNYLADDEDLSIKMAISQVIYSHSKDSNNEFSENPLPKLQQTYVGSFYQDAFTSISFENDYVSKFLIEYVPAHNENQNLVRYNDDTPTAYTMKFYEKYARNYDNISFVFENNDSIPYLKPSVANSVYKFLVRLDTSNRNAYDSFVNFYSEMLQKCEDIVFNSSEYQNGHYQEYLKYRKKVTQAIDTTIILSIFLAYFPVILLPMFIFKDGRSLGKIILRIGTINTDKSEVELWKWLIRSVMGGLSFLFLAFFIVLLPPFNGLSYIMYLPYISLGKLDLTLISIVIISFVFTAINGILILLSHEKRSISDFIFKTITVDVTALDEPDTDEKNETHL